MRLATLSTESGTVAALVNDDGSYRPLPGLADVGAWLAADPARREAALSAAGENAASDISAQDARVRQPVLTPQKIFCVGLNYRNHIEETGNETPEKPTVFAKYAGSLCGPYDSIPIPAEDHRVDWEGELCIVIGAGGRRLSPDAAREAIGGYTIANDISMRGWQGQTLQWLQGKAWEASTPVGPWVVTPDEFDPAARITTRVNGEVVQEDSVADQVFGPADLVSHLSTMITLNPGDLILTGTPAGVALGRRNAEGRHPWLVPGDVVEVAIQGLGTQRNEMVAE